MNVVVPEDKPCLAEGAARAIEALSDQSGELREALKSPEAAAAYVDAATSPADRDLRRTLTFATRWGTGASSRAAAHTLLYAGAYDGDAEGEAAYQRMMGRWEEVE